MKLADITSAPPLKHLSKGAADAIASVEALAQQQSTAPQEAAQFAPLEQPETGVRCSFTLNPETDTLSFLSAHLLDVEAERHRAEFRITIKFK